jgi:Domain of unknown function (DUF6046)
MTVIEIQDVMSQVFGVKPMPVIYDSAPQTSKAWGKLAAVGYELSYDSSILGTPWIEQVFFAKTRDWRGVEFEGFELPATTMIDVSCRKNIVETAVAGRDGTFKELISAEDYRLRVRGLLINHKSLDPPHAEMRSLHELFKMQGSIAVEGRLMRLLDIDKVVIVSYNMGATTGMPGVRSFEMELISDQVEEMELKQ